MEKIKRYAGVVVKYNDKVLLCKRNEFGYLPGVWSIPGGKIENGEAPVQAASREFFEETNFDIDGVLKLVGFIETPDKGLMYVYLHEPKEQIIPNLEDAIDGYEHTKCGYFSKKTLPLSENDQLYKILIKILQ